MASRSAMQGYGTAIGTLLGAFLRGQEEKNKAETLRQLLEQQRRDVEAAQMQAGVLQGPPRPVMQQAPQQRGGFLDTLLGIPRTIGAGLTAGSPEISGLEEQFRAGSEELGRARTMGDWLQKLQTENKLPLSTSKQQEIAAETQARKELEQMGISSREKLTQQEIASREKIASMPSRMTPLDELKYDYYRRNPNALGGVAGGKPVVRQVGDTLAAVNPSTGQTIWTMPNPKKRSVRDLAVEAVGKGETLPGFSPEETKRIAVGALNLEDMLLMGIMGAGGGAAPTSTPAPVPVSPGVKASGTPTKTKKPLSEMTNEELLQELNR